MEFYRHIILVIAAFLCKGYAEILNFSGGSRSNLTFPKDFYFGVSTAAVQIEGAWNLDGKSPSIWDHLVHTNKSFVKDGSNADVAADSYHLYKRDAQMVHELGVDIYRFSISWPRVLPTGLANEVNPLGIQYYTNLIDELIKYNITPMVTIYHWDLPQRLQDIGGWTNAHIVDYYTDYAKILFDNFANKVKYWVTFNEPMQTCLEGYGGTYRAPVLNRHGIAEYLCTHNLLKAHANVYHLYRRDYHSLYGGQIGLSLDSNWAEPKTNSERDKEAAELYLKTHVGWYAHPVYSAEGNYPPELIKLVDEKSRAQNYSRSRLPKFSPEEVAFIRGTADFFGLNHYTTYLLSMADGEVGAIPSHENDVGIVRVQDPKWPSRSSSTWLKCITYQDVVDSLLSAESAGRDVRMIQDRFSTGASTSYGPSVGAPPPSGGEPMDINAVQTNNSTRLCYRCGDRHPGECRFVNTVCRYCKKKGHLEKICLTKKKNFQNRSINFNDEPGEHLNGIYCVQSTSRVPPYEVEVSLAGVPVRMQVDSGASFSIVNQRTWAALRGRLPHAALRPADLSLRTWTETPVRLIGRATLRVKYHDRERELPVIVANGDGPNLLGRDWFAPLDITMNVNLVTDSASPEIDRWITRHKEVFRDGLGTYRGQPVAIHLKKGATPRFLKARPVPYAIRERVETEINRLVGEGVLRPTSYSEWATPVVPIVKKSGEIRLCGDYRSTVNEATESDTYPMPTANEVFATVASGRFFTTLDLERAYTQVVVDEDTSKLLTLNTCKGLYTVHRLAFGVKACPGIFQRLMTSLLAEVPGVAVLIDDIIVSGRTMEEMQERLDTVLSRIEQAGLRLNKNKCKFAKKQVEFLGFVIDAEGIHPAPSKVESIVNTPEPKNVRELQAFLGLYNFYERFVPHKATILEPLHRLLETSRTWQWTENEQKAFDTAKRLITFDLTLVHYDINKALVLTCDSSEYGVGAVLSHEGENGQDRPIAMASRTLHIHERRYSQLDKEATSIMFGITKFHNYLMGRHFRIVTDHKPLLGIFDPRKPLPSMLSPRLTRIAIALTSHSYEITYKPGPLIGNADSLSRWPQPVPEEVEDHLGEILLMAEKPEDFPYDVEHIATETKRDKTLCKVTYHIQRGWPARVTDGDLRPFWLNRLELSLQDDCILLGCRVVVPQTLRQAVLRMLHKAHSGIVQTKALARSYVWWPRLNEDIEVLVSSCAKCLEYRHMPPRTNHIWITPTRPWSRIHVDFAGPFHGRNFLIIVDAYSRWPELFMVNSTNSATVIKHLRQVFSTHGLCEVIVSDNGTAFVSSETDIFLKANNIRHVTTAPYHPATNGLAERMVQTIKDKLRKLEDLAWDVRIPNLLLGLRATPCTTTGKTPAELLMKRRLRTLLDTIHPENLQHRKTENQIQNNSKQNTRQSNVGQTVMYRNYSNAGARWLPGSIINKSGPSSYRVETENGTVVNRHIDQLIKSSPARSRTEEGETTITDVPIQEAEHSESMVENDDADLQENIQDSDNIIEIPDASKWAEILGIPPSDTSSPVTGKIIKTKFLGHSKTPYQRPHPPSDNLYLM